MAKNAKDAAEAIDGCASAAELNGKARYSRIVTTPLPDPIYKSIEAIISLHRQEAQGIPTHQRILENVAGFFGRSTFLYSLVFVLTVWLFGGFINRAAILPFDVPPFQWDEQGLDVAALLISTGVLVRQTRQENFAEQRTQLMLQLNLLSEQKIAKIIALLEELRADLPDVSDRHDPEAEAMQEAADPIAVLEALQENLAQELAAESLEPALEAALEPIVEAQSPQGSASFT